MCQVLGRVVVVAGESPMLAVLAAAAVAAGASVAVVSSSLPDDVAATVRFRADPHDPGAWERVAMHVEQQLGPIDGVAADADVDDVVRAVFDDDLRRRGHGAVVVVSSESDTGELLSRMVGTRRATPPPPPVAGPGR